MKDESIVSGTVGCLEADTAAVGNEKAITKIKTQDEALKSSETIKYSITHNPRQSILAMLRFDPNRIATLMTGIAE
ncbi:MAG: hypothetical protein HQL05_13605 [Nitrospirae bacterium]|uniref:hypothetical protein n=1 Tax=Candidatus Magnetobacterium casense TaxID=1455061 RepID=UPI00058E64F3|nr:hypothetical protein [Candidatus Magnetobacterium casensis]MBF0338851.1 hypothetical protein [Nitrospirota bacterium]